MGSIFDRRLLVVSGKGGVGKTTLSAAIGLLAAERGLRTIVVEVGEQSRLPALFGVSTSAGAEVELQAGLHSLSLDPDRALLEWLQSIGGRVSGRVLASSSTFQYFAAAAPGARELVGMIKVGELTRRSRRGPRRGGYDLVVLDAPASGHALGMLDAPRTFGAIARVGPIAAQAQRLQQLLEDPDRCDYLAVAHASELAVTETLELAGQLQEQLGRELHTVLVNGVLPQRFDLAELAAISALASDPGPASATAERARVAHAAGAAARAVSERARAQHNQLARLRRRGFAVAGVPFQFSAELGLDGVRRIAEQLRRRL